MANHEGPDAAQAQCPCPLCVGLAALRQARPEAVEHLLKAGAELLLAARALLEPAGGRPVRADAGPAADGRPPRAGGMQRIDVG
jgi:hypothetical protein